MKDISSKNYKAYERAFDTLNNRLFDGKLPEVVLTLRAGRNANGYAWAKRFKIHDSETPQDATEDSTALMEMEDADFQGTVIEKETLQAFDEIAINPATANRPARDVLGTLLHEMCHVWQFNFGKASRNGYHNQQWAGKMIEVGLRPFSIQNPDKMVGQKVTHTIEEGGAADLIFREIEDSFGADLVIELPNIEAKRPAKNSKVKFTCPVCGANAWGKESLRIMCADCEDEVNGGPTMMESEESGDENDIEEDQQ